MRKTLTTRSTLLCVGRTGDGGTERGRTDGQAVGGREKEWKREKEEVFLSLFLSRRLFLLASSKFLCLSLSFPDSLPTLVLCMRVCACLCVCACICTSLCMHVCAGIRAWPGKRAVDVKSVATTGRPQKPPADWAAATLALLSAEHEVWKREARERERD
jgi:hypothetical protein